MVVGRDPKVPTPKKRELFARTSKNTVFFQTFGKRRKSRQGDSSLGTLFDDTGPPKTIGVG